VQQHIDPSAVSTVGTRTGSPVLEPYQEHSAIPAGSPPLCKSGEPLAAASSSGREEVARGQIWRVRQMQKCDNAVVGEKLTHYESSVRGCIFKEQAIANTPQFQSFSPNVLPQTAKNNAEEPGEHGLAFGGKFMAHNPSNVEKHDVHALGRAAALPHLLRS